MPMREAFQVYLSVKAVSLGVQNSRSGALSVLLPPVLYIIQESLHAVSP